MKKINTTHFYFSNLILLWCSRVDNYRRWASGARVDLHSRACVCVCVCVRVRVDVPPRSKVMVSAHAGISDIPSYWGGLWSTEVKIISPGQKWLTAVCWRSPRLPFPSKHPTLSISTSRWWNPRWLCPWPSVPVQLGYVVLYCKITGNCLFDYLLVC